MRRTYLILLVSLFIVSGCKKNNNSGYSGTETINNILYGSGPYYAMGFSIPTGQKVSTLNSPLDVITILADADINDNVRKIFFATDNFDNSFYRFGQFADAASASLAFKNLTSFTNPNWIAEGDSVKSNQVWLFRTSTNKYAKILVKSTVAEKRDKPYAECTFEWVYQPDGSLTFPGK
jgi:hypothetical protein